MSKVIRRKKYRSYRPLIYIATIAIVVIAIAISYNLYSSRYPSEILIALNQSIDIYKYYVDIVRLTDIGFYVPVTIAIGDDGKPIAVVRGEALDKNLWNNLLNSKFNGSIIVLTEQRSIITNSSVIDNISSTVIEICRLLNITNPRGIAIMFGLSTCPHCANQRKFFYNNNIRYIFIELDKRDVIMRL